MRHALEFKKGAVCRIDVDTLPPRGAGTLRWFLTPKTTEEAAPLVDEPVAEADDRFDLARSVAKLVAQAADVDVNGSRFDGPVVPPDALEQTGPVKPRDSCSARDSAAARTPAA